MSGLPYGVTWCASALCVMLASCSESQSDLVPVDQQPSSDAGAPLLNDSETGPLPPQMQTVDAQAVLVPGPEGDSGVTVNSSDYPLNAALGDIWGVEDNHYNVDFTLTNGKFLVQPTEINGVMHSLLIPTRATAIVYAELYSPGNSLMFVSYSYSGTGDDAGLLAGNAFFDSAFVGVDINNSGDVEDDEKLAVIDGTVEFTGTLPNVELRFSLTLEDGQLAEGHYTGLFDFADRQ